MIALIQWRKTIKIVDDRTAVVLQAVDQPDKNS